MICTKFWNIRESPMAKFEIEVPELHWATKEVEAETIEDAFRKVLAGDEESETSVEYSRTFEPSEVHWAPAEFKGVRTFAQQCKHVAAVLYMVSAGALEEKVPVDLGAGENGPDSVKTKDQVVKFLNDAFSHAT